jgi:hypothetical protein
MWSSAPQRLLGQAGNVPTRRACSIRSRPPWMPSPVAASAVSSARWYARSSAPRAAKPSSLSPPPADSPPSVGLRLLPNGGPGAGAATAAASSASGSSSSSEVAASRRRATSATLSCSTF